MKVLITGSTGFTGQAICRILDEAGLDLIRVGGPPKPSGESVPENRKNRRCDIAVDLTDADSMSKLNKYKDVFCIIHCAGLAHQFGETENGRFFEVNVEGTKNIACQAAGMKVDRLILISTVAVYGRSRKFEDLDEHEYQENAVCRPAGSYGQSKFEGEKTATLICRENNIKLTILRPSTVLGEQDPGNFMRLIKAVDTRRFLWLGNGRNKKSFVYKDDLGRACLEIIRKSSQPLEILNVTAEAVSIRKIMLSLKKNLRRRIPRIPLDPRIVRRISRTRHRQVQKSDPAGHQNRGWRARLKKYSETLEKWFAEEVYSGDKLKNIYDFTPSISVEEALARECRDYLERKC